MLIVDRHEIIHLDLTDFKEAATNKPTKAKESVHLSKLIGRLRGVLYSWGYWKPNNHCNHETIMLLNNYLIYESMQLFITTIYICIHVAPTVYTKPADLYLPTLTWCSDCNEIRSFFSKSTSRVKEMDTQKLQYIFVCFFEFLTTSLPLWVRLYPGALSRIP